MELNIVYEDSEILVCEKKPGIPVQSDRSLEPDLVNGLKNYIYKKEAGRQPYIGLVHRLDRPVGGVMVFAKTQQAAKELSRQIQEKKVQKKYLCIVTGAFPEQIGREPVVLMDYIRKDGRTNTARIVLPEDKQGKCAKLAYVVKGVKDHCSLLEVELFTGRHHQIRVQMAAHVAGLAGDTKYNRESCEKGKWNALALYSHALAFYHPKTKKWMEFSLSPKGEMWEGF